MTALSILRAFAEEIGSLKNGYDNRNYCGTCIRWADQCFAPCPGFLARAALEAAAKVPGPMHDPDLRLAVFNAVFESCDADQESAASCTSDVLRVIHAYQRGGKP